MQLIMTINEKIIAVVDAAIGNSKAYENLSPVSEETRSYCLEKFNIDVSGYYHYIDSDIVRHLIKRHGQSSNDRHPISNQDFLLIPVIQKEFDHRWTTKTKQGLFSITYVKKIVDTYYYVEEIRTGKKKLALKELRKTGKFTKK